MSAARKTRNLTKYSRYTNFFKNWERQKGVSENNAKMQPSFLSQNYFQPDGTFVSQDDQIGDDKWPIKIGDRVQVMTPNPDVPDDKFKVGKVTALARETNGVYVDGLGGTIKTIIPPQGFFENQKTPVIDLPRPVPIKNIRLVVSTREENPETGAIEEKDLAVHSVEIDAKNKYYDADYNQFLPRRTLRHDLDTEIPWPRPEKPLAPSSGPLTTNSELSARRTWFPQSLLEPPVPAGALSQIRNPYSKFKRNTRVHYTVSQEEAQRVLAKMPKMPVPKQKKEYQRMFKDAMEKARPKALTKEELAEIENFVGVAIEDGLEKRRIEEEKHYQMYQ